MLSAIDIKKSKPQYKIIVINEKKLDSSTMRIFYLNNSDNKWNNKIYSLAVLMKYLLKEKTL